MVTSSKSFQDVVEHNKNEEGVKKNFYAKFEEKKAKKGGGFNESFSEGPVSLASISHRYSGRPIQSAMQVSYRGPSGTSRQLSG